jgi:hypothetical protein
MSDIVDIEDAKIFRRAGLPLAALDAGEEVTISPIDKWSWSPLEGRPQ